jgi:CRP-like cAMP-binding protein
MERLWPRLIRAELPFKSVLWSAGEPVTGLHFVEAGTVSILAAMSDGAQIEVGLVGHEGVAGVSAFLGAPTSPFEALVQVEGAALRLPVSSLRAALTDAPSLMPLILRYVDSYHFQVSQTAACNGRHQIEQRLARWILMTDDRVGGHDFPMRHEFMSMMLGVQRPGVSLALAALRHAGLVRHEKGSMHVLDRTGLEAAACECYEMVRRRFEWPAKSSDA